MKKRFLTLLLILPMLAFCTEKPAPEPDKQEQEGDDKEGKDDKDKDTDTDEDADLYADAAPELKSGDVVQATNPIVEKFLNEVNYTDHTCTESTKVMDYYGGFNGKAYNENGELDPNGTVLDWTTAAYASHKGIWPDGDKPMKYSIRWKKADLGDDTGKLNLHLEDKLGWKGDLEVAAGSVYAEITNLVPNDDYTYKVTTASGKTVAQGTFKTKASSTLHQCFFTGSTKKSEAKSYQAGGARNCRDLGGWKTLDGKTIKYRKVYRGGRLNEKWTPYPLNKTGEKEVLFEGIAAELDLRGHSDVMTTPAVQGLDHCAPVIEQGGKTMLVSDAAKTKECFEFIVKCVRENKPVHFHCSLGRDRTGTLGILLMGLLGVREGDIAKEYELTYFAPVGYCVSSSDKESNPGPLFKNTRMAWVYSDVVPYFWSLADTQEPAGFAHGVEKYLKDVAGVAQKDIDDFRSLMLE